MAVSVGGRFTIDTRFRAHPHTEGDPREAQVEPIREPLPPPRVHAPNEHGLCHFSPLAFRSRKSRSRLF